MIKFYILPGLWQTDVGRYFRFNEQIEGRRYQSRPRNNVSSESNTLPLSFIEIRTKPETTTCPMKPK